LLPMLFYLFLIGLALLLVCCLMSIFNFILLLFIE